MSHTPGPWTAKFYGMSDEKIAAMREAGMEPTRILQNDGGMPITADDKRIAVADLIREDVKRGDAWEAEDPERDANARLIAAAPDLLEALEAINLATLENNPNDKPSPLTDAQRRQINDLARAAIAKARGQS